MSGIFHWGTSVNIWLQQMSPALDAPFKAVTFCGEELFFLIFLPLIYWSINRVAGARLLALFLFSAWINSFAKILAGDLRPYQYDSNVKALQQLDSFGFPSGHTQSSVTVWAYLAAVFRKNWLWVLAVAMMILVPLSRLYLGVHDVPDLIGGYLIGLVLVLLFIRLEPAVTSWLQKKSLAILLTISIIVPVIMVLASPGLNKECITSASTLMGMCIGFALERKFINFSSDGPPAKKALRYILGLVVIIGLWAGLKIAFKNLEPELAFRFVRYLLIGLWGALGAPWVFVKLRLAECRPSEN